MNGYRGKHRKPGNDVNPEWWERAISGTCSHGGHGFDGDTCDDAPGDSSEE